MDRELLAAARKIYREAAPVLAVSLFAGLFAGAVLGERRMTRAFEDYPGLLLLLPAFLATRGNVYAALGARVSSGVHQGLLPPRFERDRRLGNAVVASVVNGVGISVFVAVVAWLLMGVLGRPAAPLSELVLITLVAGVLTSAVMIFGLLALIFQGYRRGIDPDNLVGPIVTTFGDVFGVAFLYVGVLTAAWVI
ncbi:MAG: magnesium transporter [Halobacteriales archaeon]